MKVLKGTIKHKFFVVFSIEGCSCFGIHSSFYTWAVTWKLGSVDVMSGEQISFYSRAVVEGKISLRTAQSGE